MRLVVRRSTGPPATIGDISVMAHEVHYTRNGLRLSDLIFLERRRGRYGSLPSGLGRLALIDFIVWTYHHPLKTET